MKKIFILLSLFCQISFSQEPEINTGFVSKNVNESSSDDVLVDNTDEIILTKREEPKIDNWMSVIQHKNRNYLEIENKLKHGQNPNQNIFDGSTMGHLAAWQNDEKLLNLALQYKVDINYTNKNGETPVHWAAASKNINLLNMISNDKLFLKSINKTTKSGRTPLHFNALYSGNLEILKFLIQNKIDLNIQDINGQTALDYAIISQKWDFAEILLINGANPNIKDKNEETFDSYLLTRGNSEGYLKLFKWTSTSTQTILKSRLVNYRISTN
jgi:ankyrin repeat protein